MLSLLKRFSRDDKGATAIEYGLIAALIAVVVIGAFVGLGGALGEMFNGNDQSIGGAMDGALNS